MKKVFRRSDPLAWLLYGGLGVWCAVVMARYGWLPPGVLGPGSNPPKLSPGDPTWAGILETARRFFAGHAVILPWLIGILGWGATTLRWTGCARPSQGGPIRFTAGLAMGSLLLLALGLVGLWESGVALGVTLVGIIALGRMRPLGDRGGGPLRTPPGRPARAGERIVNTVLALLAGIAVFFVLTGCLGPDTYYDATYYVLAIPARFVAEHKVIGLPYHAYSGLPGGMTMLYGWQWLLGGEPVVRAWRPWLFLAVFWSVSSLSRRLGVGGAGLAPAVVFATMPVFLYNAMRTKEDVEAVLLAMASILVVVDSGARPVGARRLALAGGLAGTAMAVKYTAVIWAPWWMLLLAAQGGMRGLGRRLVIMAASGLAFLAPWLARDFLVFGNPVYPFATGVFSRGFQLDPGLLIRMHQELAERVRPSPGGGWTAPFRVVEAVARQCGPAVPFLLPSLLLALWRGATRAHVRLAVLTFASLITWAALTHVPRFGFVAWAFLCVIAVGAAGGARGQEPWRRAVVGALCAAISLANLGMAASVWRGEFGGPDVLLGRYAPGAVVRQRMLRAPWELLDAVGSRLTPRARVLIAGDFRGLYWPARALSQSLFDEQILDRVVRESPDATRAACRLRQLATHLYVNDDEVARLKYAYMYPILRFDDRGRSVMRRLWRRWMDEIGHQGPAMLFAMRRAPRTMGMGPNLPLCLDEPAQRTVLQLGTTITWQTTEGAHVRKTR